MSSSSVAATTDSHLISTKEADFLEQDKPIRGQNYACVSFISPEDVIKRKDCFFFEEFIKAAANDFKTLTKNLKELYPTHTQGIVAIEDRYRYLFDPSDVNEEYRRFKENHPELETEYTEKNGFQTNVRGIKIRGVYDTLHEAQVRSQVLSRTENGKHNIFIAQVGCWCPWSPNPNDIENVEYSESALNTLMKGYLENQQKRDAFFQERKEELMQMAMREAEKQKEANEAAAKAEVGAIANAEAGAATSEPPVAVNTEAAPAETIPQDLTQQLTSEDPWLQRKQQDA